jgi:beta-galactosidase
VARQLRRSLLDYMAGERFAPRTTVALADLRGILFDTRIMAKLGAQASGPGRGAAALVDGDPNTFWMAGRPPRPGFVRAQPRGEGGFVPPGPTAHPYEITVDFAAPAAMRGLVLMPRQNDREHTGDVREYTVAVSDDGQSWREMGKGELTSSFEPKRIAFGDVVTAQHLRFTALSGFGEDRSAALGELAIDYAGPPLPETSEAGDVRYERARSATPEIEEAGPPPPR